MITIFHRKEIFTTYDMTRFSDVCAKPEQNGIKYETKIADRLNTSVFGAGERSRVGSCGNDPKKMYEYTVFVRKEDYERAEFLLRS